MKKIGFLSFGHWTPSPQSKVWTASDALLQLARGKNIDLLEFSHALIEAAAVTRFASSHMKDPDATPGTEPSGGEAPLA